LGEAIEALRLADIRFSRVQLEVRGNLIYLRGTVSHWEHIHEFARAIARIPNVKDIVFEDVRVDGSP
jgi:hypothetical protein